LSRKKVIVYVAKQREGGEEKKRILVCGVMATRKKETAGEGVFWGGRKKILVDEYQVVNDFKLWRKWRGKKKRKKESSVCTMHKCPERREKKEKRKGVANKPFPWSRGLESQFIDLEKRVVLLKPHRILCVDQS